MLFACEACTGDSETDETGVAEVGGAGGSTGLGGAEGAGGLLEAAAKVARVGEDGDDGGASSCLVEMLCFERVCGLGGGDLRSFELGMEVDPRGAALSAVINFLSVRIFLDVEVAADFEFLFSFAEVGQ
jgi:hypothetical protein